MSDTEEEYPDPQETVDRQEAPLYVRVAQAVGMDPIHPDTPIVSAYDVATAMQDASSSDPYAAASDPTQPVGLRYTRRGLVVPGLPPRDLTVQEVCDWVRCQDDGGPIRGGLDGLLHSYSGAYEATPDTPTLPTWAELTTGQPPTG